MTILKILSLCFLMCLPLRAENFSFMLSDAEQQALGPDNDWDENLVSKPASGEGKNILQEVVFLSAILYFSPDKWTLWLNDQVVHQQGKFEGAMLKSVSPNHVIFSLGDDGQEEFLLKPNQSLIVTTRKVVEGDRRAFSEPHPLDKPSEAPEHKDHEVTSEQGFKQ